MQDEGYRRVDERLLEDFQAELAAEKEGRRRKMAKVGAGLVLGVVAAGWFAFFYSGEGGLMSIPAPEKPVATPMPDVDELLSRPGEGETTVDDEAAMAALQGQNRIDQDVAAPGSLMGKGPTPVEPKPTAAPTAAPTAVSTPAPTVEPTPASTPEPIAESGDESSTAMVTPVAEAPTDESMDAPAPKRMRLYTVQVRATLDGVEAQQLRDRLRDQGFSSWISQGKAKRRRYAVEVGRFDSIGKGAPHSSQLKFHGFDNRVAYIDGGKVTLRLGSFVRRDEATALAERAAGSGFPARVEDRSEPAPLFMVRVGRFDDKTEAVAADERLRGVGVATLGVAGVK
jgi:cell division septation protein DedD